MSIYKQTICKKCGGTKTEIIEDEHKEPETFRIEIPEPCECNQPIKR